MKAYICSHLSPPTYMYLTTDLFCFLSFPSWFVCMSFFSLPLGVTGVATPPVLAPPNCGWMPIVSHGGIVLGVAAH